MQINSIEIEGLWSYRNAQRIDITGQPLIVGVGENGAGKSALLVGAVLAAFYGKFPTRTVDESITTGATQGKVTLEFTLHSAHYRITRTYPRTGTASGQVLIEDTNEKTGWRAVTEKGIRETNDYIVSLLGMDHHTATMTWIAEQGQYGKFAAAQPADRFKLLSTVFGLDGYTAKATLAAGHARKADTEVTRLDGRIDELAGSLDDNGDIIVDGIGGMSDGEIGDRVTEAEAAVDVVSSSLAELNAGDPARTTVEARQAYELVRNTRVSRLDAANVTKARGERTLLEARERAVRARAAADARFESSVSAARRMTSDAREQASIARRDAAAQLMSIAAAERDLPGLADTVTGYRDAAVTARADAAAASESITTNRTSHATLKRSWTDLKERVADANDRIAVLERTASEADHAECFTCGQHLTAADARALIELQEAHVVELRARQVTLRADAIAASESADSDTIRRDSLLSEADKHDVAAAEAARQVTIKEQLIASKAQANQVEAAAAQMITRAGKDEQAALAAAAAEQSAANVTANAEETAVITEIESEVAAANVTVTETSSPSLAEEKLLRTLTVMEEQVAVEAADVDIRRQQMTAKRDRLREEAFLYHQETARRIEQHQLRQQQLDRVAELTKERAVAVIDRDTHQALQKAYSPAGIPAMVLAGVLEQLNETVNTALHRLSRGELSAQLSTSRETSKGSETKVTVYVETPTGTRAYETLSGGQKFRVDLAIRTGLAATIARGTGTPIGTFILDEGWGTLDEKGVLSTVDTLFRLSEDTNVLTVSHVDSVRDAFPARVEVTVEGDSSVARLVAA